MSIVEKLTEGIINRDLAQEGAALISKWENTGLLEGLGNDTQRNGLARLLENQAKELLRESSSMGAGQDVQGFAAVAFPLVRRVFGALIANDLVSVQPMSLPSGLIFFLDFTVSSEIGGAAAEQRLGYPTASSLYGGGVVGSQITGGVQLTQANAERGPYALNNGYSSPTGSATMTLTAITSGTFGASAEVDRLCQFDPDIASGSDAVYVGSFSLSTITDTPGQFNQDDLVTLTVTSSAGAGLFGTGISQIRRLTRFSGSSTSVVLVVGVTYGTAAESAVTMATITGSQNYTFAQTDNFGGSTGSPIGAVIPTTLWGLEGNPHIPEIDIKVDSVAVTAVTKKLKAKWTPELGQDLNAYHNLDAEVELTQILSEQIALEIDQEILEDLVVGSAAGIRYWSRAAGRFLNRETGVEIGVTTSTPDFTGNVSEWYETLIETINDVSAQIHRKTLRGAANFVVCGPEVANILEFTAGFRANVTADSDRGDAGAVKVGSLSKKFDVIVDPYFPRNLVLVGRRGSSFLESGYVYAPYVPLQTTPTIFGVEDFVPRKGVMTRYAKKMVRPDMYGLVVVRDLV